MDEPARFLFSANKMHYLCIFRILMSEQLSLLNSNTFIRNIETLLSQNKSLYTGNSQSNQLNVVINNDSSQTLRP